MMRTVWPLLSFTWLGHAILWAHRLRAASKVPQTLIESTATPSQRIPLHHAPLQLGCSPVAQYRYKGSILSSFKLHQTFVLDLESWIFCGVPGSEFKTSPPHPLAGSNPTLPRISSSGTGGSPRIKSYTKPTPTKEAIQKPRQEKCVLKTGGSARTKNTNQFTQH